MTEMNEAKQKFNEQGTISKKFTIPSLFWKEWEQDCILNHNNTYSLKMQSDHTYKKDMQVFIDSIIIDMISIKGELLELKQKVYELQNTTVESTQRKQAKTLG